MQTHDMMKMKQFATGWQKLIRANALDAEDTIDTFVLKVALRRRRGRGRGRGTGVQNFLKRYACICSELVALHQVGTEIEAIKARISSLTTSLQTYNIKSIGGGEGERSSGINSRNERQIHLSSGKNNFKWKSTSLYLMRDLCLSKAKEENFL